MSLTPFYEAGPVIQMHAISALIAALLGPFILYGRKGTKRHKLLGRIWALAMGAAIASSAFIWQIRLIGPFSPVHLLSLLGAWGLVSGVTHAVKGRVAAHEASMKSLYFWALGAAGVFTFLPGRVMSLVVFPAHPLFGFALVLGLYLLVLGLRKVRRSHHLSKA